jgi:guanine deaminase
MTLDHPDGVDLAAGDLIRSDDRAIAHAVDLAVRNVQEGGGPFGAVIVRGDRLVAVGQNRVTRDNDPTAHAEVVAIRRACAALGSFSLAGCTLYSSCEPCPLCLAACLWARLDRVVFAADRNDAARGGFDDGAFYEQFARAPKSWTLPVVEELRPPNAGEPFDVWLAHPTRVDY